MKQNRKTQSFIPPRPSSGSSFSQKNRSIYDSKQSESEYSTKSLMDQLQGAFNIMDIYSQIDEKKVYNQQNKITFSGYSQFDDYMDVDKQNNKIIDEKARKQKRQLNTISNTPLNGQDILAKAKSLLQDQKNNIDNIKERQKKQTKYKTKVPKDGAFLTGINVYKEEEEVSSPIVNQLEEFKNEEQEEEGDNFNVEDYMKELVYEEKQRSEDYSDIWRLINAAKKECCEYGEELYQLKNITSETNSQLNSVQRGVKHQVIADLNQGIERAIPGGVKQNVFRQREYDLISSSSGSLANKEIQKKKLPKMNYNQSQKNIRPKNKSQISTNLMDQVKMKDELKSNQTKFSSKPLQRASVIDTRDEYL